MYENHSDDYSDDLYGADSFAGTPDGQPTGHDYVSGGPLGRRVSTSATWSQPELTSGAERMKLAVEPRSTIERPLRLAYIGPNFQIGGVRQHAIALAKFLDSDRIRLDRFLLTDPTGLTGKAHDNLPAPVAICDDRALDRLANECDVALVWGSGLNRLRRLRGLQRVFVAHGETAWTRTTLQSLAPVIDHVVAVSERVKRRVCDGFPTTTILNGVDTARLSLANPVEAVRERFAFAASDFVIGAVGRLTREKCFDLLIETVSRLPARFKLLLVGSGSRSAELLDFANRLIPGRFAVVAADDYLGDYFAAMDSLAMVSAHEGFSLVVAEAMMCGRPVIATPVGCVPELISDRVSGVIVEPTVDSIAAAATGLANHPHWARGVAEEGRQIARTRLLASRMARDYERLLIRLCGTATDAAASKTPIRAASMLADGVMYEDEAGSEA